MAELMMFQPGRAFMDSYNQARAGSLAKIAFTEPQRRQSALADLYGLDPQAASSMKKEFDAQEQEQLKTFATAFVNAPDDNMREQMYGRAKEMWRPRFQALGSDIPDDWRQALPTIQALAGVGQQQPPAKVLEAQYFAKEMGLDKDPKAYAAYMRKVSGFDGDPAEIKIHPTTGVMHQFRDGGVDIYDWNTGKWNFVRGPNYVTQQNPQPEVSDQNPPPQTGGKQPPPQIAGADPKATFQTLANRYGAQITSVNRTPEQNARVGGVANSFHLTGQAGDFVVPQQNKAQFMAEAKAMGFEAIDEGDHIHLEPRGRPMGAPAVGGAPSAPPQSPNNPFAKVPEPKPATWNAPVVETRGGKQVRVRYGTQDGQPIEQVIGEAEPDIKPKKPWPTAALKVYNTLSGDLQVTEQLDTMMADMKSLFSDPKFELGPIQNKQYEYANWSGNSTPQSRAYAKLSANLSKLRNDSLRLNKGTQTDGDAQRAWDEIMANMNDKELVMERLADIERYNELALAEKQYQLEVFEEQYGKPNATRPPANPTAGGARPTAGDPKVGEVIGGYRFKGGDPSKQQSWEKVQ